MKARIASDIRVDTGITTGLSFDSRTLTLFDATKGNALLSAANERVLGHG